ncbi:hypothetical protein [Gluconobacter kanchanaburiensis]|uniref:Uncharacterized protein n=1 Tax=Gluconobacter kanchanaburiensis NBRC 103587 TaxID=1307948 RepID=A0A511BBE0_9PROT|nr:hypothetical protein [Gluconobacter kanchanaburiensis]GBR70478.1 hypothetical protein AA103587_1891 [Gluconobacter kanchanaburiensis NBRC 103587]GEK97131.1 hypothetical protein GKA01_23280 [Gluconobacter kanchanaburiensis NBRC 103587]
MREPRSAWRAWLLAALLSPPIMEPEHVERFGADTPMKCLGQPAELSGVCVFLAGD